MKDKIRYFLLPPEEIAYVGFIIHAYEGLAVVRTLDGEKGLVEMLIAPGLEDELSDLLEALSQEIPMRELSFKEVEAMAKDLDLCPLEG